MTEILVKGRNSMKCKVVMLAMLVFAVGSAFANSQSSAGGAGRVALIVGVALVILMVARVFLHFVFAAGRGVALAALMVARVWEKHRTKAQTAQGHASGKRLTDWDKVLKLRPLAESGNADAQLSLGMAYFSGVAVVDDFREARRLFALSAKQGNALAGILCQATKTPGGNRTNETPTTSPDPELIDAWRRAADDGKPDGCFCYGIAKLRGYGCDADISQAVALLKKAAEAGFATAQYLVGLALIHGCGGLSRDERAGALLVGKAAMSGHDDALLCFADFHRQGIFLSKDSHAAFEYMQAAADSGNAAAQRLLAVAYTNGDGVEKDEGLAKKYFDLSEGPHRTQVDLVPLLLGTGKRTENDEAKVNADGSVTFSKIPPGGAMEMLRVAYEKTRTPRPAAKDGQLAFLDAGQDGILRAILWKQQKKVIVDLAKCRLYLSEGWNLTPEIEARGPANVIARFAGPGPHEWVSVEYLFLSPDHVNDDLGDWVNVSRTLFGRLDLQVHSDKKSGVANFKEVSFGRLRSRDTIYMKYHQADDMVAYAGTLEIEERLHRIFIVIVRRGRDSWKFEYVFPAADGVTREAQSFHHEEIATAARMFVPLESYGCAKCPLCGVAVDDPSDGKIGEGITVWLKNFTLFDDMPKLGRGGVTLACCDACKEKTLSEGLSRKIIEGIPDVKSQLDKGASIVEFKCGEKDVAMLD